jgi:L-arabinonolactonase
MNPVRTIAVGNALGECILWDEQTQSVWWTDIEGCGLYAFDWRGQSLRRFAMPERLGAFGFVKASGLLVGAFAGGFALFDPVSGLKSSIVRPDGLAPGMRLNDGRVDRRGRLWAGAMEEPAGGARNARLYCVGGGAVHTREQGLGISNGICWSPDGTIFYLADSVRHVIWRYGFDPESGTISDRREFVRTPGDAFPDGAAVDAEGFVWSAHWGASRVVRYAPDGSIDRVLHMPVSQPSCVAFGGENLDLLFVTSARTRLNEAALAAQTGAGDVFVYNVDVKGLPESRFDMGSWPPIGDPGGQR